ncbi:MAG: hypothetical protein R3B51_05775 [Thermodesulfobacteriota bacterium]
MAKTKNVNNALMTGVVKLEKTSAIPMIIRNSRYSKYIALKNSA